MRDVSRQVKVTGRLSNLQRKRKVSYKFYVPRPLLYLGILFRKVTYLLHYLGHKTGVNAHKSERSGESKQDEWSFTTFLGVWSGV